MDQTLFPEARGAALNAVINKSIIFMGESWRMCFWRDPTGDQHMQQQVWYEQGEQHSLGNS